jgi:uncharacterized protein YbjT (DUF2867 family)
VARILLVGGGCRGRQLAGELVADGHAVRITTRREAGRAAIERTGSECWVGTPDRLATLRGALDGVTVACWMLATADGTPEQLVELHDTRLEFFLTQAIDTTVRGILYEARGSTAAAPALAAGELLTRRMCELNQIPLGWIREDPRDTAAWVAEARAGIDRFLGS